MLFFGLFPVVVVLFLYLKMKQESIWKQKENEREQADFVQFGIVAVVVGALSFGCVRLIAFVAVGFSQRVASHI